MKGSLKLIPVVLLSSALALPALAQVGGAPVNMPAPASTTAHPGNPEKAFDKHHPYARHFAEFLKGHPGLEGDLTRDPSLVRDKAYMKAHPDLEEYFKKHPGVAEDFRGHPSQFMTRVNRIYGGRGPY